jgi:hypothetical protein
MAAVKKEKALPFSGTGQFTKHPDFKFLFVTWWRRD